MTTRIDNDTQPLVLDRVQVAMMRTAIQSLYNTGAYQEEPDTHKAYRKHTRDYLLDMLEGGKDGPDETE